jgi:hypothetical protein
MAPLNSSRRWQDSPLYLSPLPATVGYYDDFSDTDRWLVTSEGSVVWTLLYDGQSRRLDFSSWDNPVRKLIQHWCAHNVRKVAPRTAEVYLRAMKSVPADWLAELLRIGPKDLRSFWNARRADGMSHYVSWPLRSFLYFSAIRTNNAHCGIFPECCLFMQ